MARRYRKYRPPEHEGRIKTDFVSEDNDYVVRSRKKNWVDMSGFIPRSMKNRRDAREVFDSDKDDYGNAGIVRLPIIKESDKW